MYIEIILQQMGEFEIKMTPGAEKIDYLKNQGLCKKSSLFPMCNGFQAS